MAQVGGNAMTLRVPSFWAAATSASIPPPASADCAVAQSVVVVELLPVAVGDELLSLPHAARASPSAASAAVPAKRVRRGVCIVVVLRISTVSSPRVGCCYTTSGLLRVQTMPGKTLREQSVNDS